jgi:hypothetical protein
MPVEPGDECQFPKPFPEDFRDCSAYQPRLIFPTDASNRPLRPIWTCVHLAAASRSRGGWYASCGLGDAAGRARWLEDTGELGAAVSALRADVVRSGAPLLRRLMAARARDPQVQPVETAGIREAVLSNFDTALARHEPRLAAVVADPAELREAFRLVLDSFLGVPNAEPIASPALVAGFGPAARLFFKPELEVNLNPA